MAAECVGVMSVMSTPGTGATLAETERVELLLRPISNKLIFFVSCPTYGYNQPEENFSRTPDVIYKLRL